MPSVAFVLNASVLSTYDALASCTGGQPTYDALAAKEVSLLGVERLLLQRCPTEETVEAQLMPELAMSTEFLIPDGYRLPTGVTVVGLVLVVTLRAAHNLVGDVHESLPPTEFCIAVPTAEVALVPLLAQGLGVGVKEDELQ